MKPLDMEYRDGWSNLKSNFPEVLRRQIGRVVPSGKRETEDPNINVAVILQEISIILVSDK
tara:strand:+ start:142 stop:324 length:183 start_codon:yes stop_codon:yes gene_type:complete